MTSLVASSSPQEHLHVHLRQVFQHLHDHGVIINPSKYEFGATSLHFLGHQIEGTGI